MRWTTVAVGAAWAGSIAFALTMLIAFPRNVVSPAQFALVVAVALVPLVLASVIARRVPGNAASALLAAAGFVVVAADTASEDVLGPLEGGWMLLFLPFAILLLVVPSGRAASRLWAAAGWTIAAVVAAFMGIVALEWFVPSTTDPTNPPAWGLLFAFFGLLVVCAAAPIARYRRAVEDQRMRLRWVFLAGTSLPITLLLCWASYLLLGGPELVVFGLLVMYVAIPAGVAIALVRPTLFDIDRAAVATVSAGVLSILVLGILSIASAIIGVALVSWSPVAAIATTASLTVLAVVAYRFVRRGFDRVLYPERARAVSAVRRLARLADTGEAEPESVQEVLRASLRDPELVVAYRGFTDHALSSFDGAAVSQNAVSTAVRLRGEEIGAIVPSASRTKAPAGDIARAAAPLVDAARMRAELNRATAEVEASRKRILHAGYEERRRLERDLHDGAQQRLVALGMQLRVLQRTSPADGAVTVALDTAVAQLGTAVAELRQLAHGMRPSALDDGLGAALADLTRLSPETIELDVHAPDLPDAVATTAYFVASEAVTNALRHAEASRIRVEVRQADDTLRLTIVDDGRGGASLRATGGLAGLADRVGALGGRLAVTSTDGAGTTVEATLPCAS